MFHRSLEEFRGFAQQALINADSCGLGADSQLDDRVLRTVKLS
jgi:hypothetical protein